MSRYIQTPGGLVQLDSGTGAPSTTYTRPSDWLAMPAMTNGDQKVAVLTAVYDNSTNHVAVLVTGNYTVDWGDGSAAENFNSGVKAEHTYDYADLGAGTLSTRGYRQAIISITPQSGQNLLTVDLAEPNTTDGISTHYSLWLSTKIAGQNITQVTFNGTCKSTQLEEYEWVGDCNLTSCSNMFRECRGLQSVSLFDTSAVTNMSYMFFGCYSLQELPTFDTSACTTITYMFYECLSLREIPAFDFSSVAIAAYAFRYCIALKTTPDFNFAALTAANYMFSDCDALETVGNITGALISNIANMFRNCASLRRMPLFDTSNATSANSMFYGANTLETLPAFDLSACTDMQNIFRNCYSLRYAGTLDFSICTGAGNAFTNCYSLSDVVLTGMNVDLDLTNCNLGAAEINAVFTALGTGAATITVTGNPGAATCDPSIATAKSKTVVTA